VRAGNFEYIAAEERELILLPQELFVRKEIPKVGWQRATHTRTGCNIFQDLPI
jgi:hypothetical protein